METGVQLHDNQLNLLDSGAWPGPDPGFAGMTKKNKFGLFTKLSRLPERIKGKKKKRWVGRVEGKPVYGYPVLWKIPGFPGVAKAIRTLKAVQMRIPREVYKAQNRGVKVSLELSVVTGRFVPPAASRVASWGPQLAVGFNFFPWPSSKYVLQCNTWKHRALQ